jgi:hypothetical protein
MASRESTLSIYLNVIENSRLQQQQSEQETDRLIRFEAEKLAVLALAREIVSSAEIV